EPDMAEYCTMVSLSAPILSIQFRSQRMHCFGPILRIRIIHLNGSVTEINNDLNLVSVNYCLFNDMLTGEIMNPISIRPLKQPFILVSYMETDYSYGKWYQWGTVLNWNEVPFLLEYPLFMVYASEKIFCPIKSLIEININKELFLHVNSYGNSIGVSQYSVDVNGNLSYDALFYQSPIQPLIIPFLRHWPPLMKVMKYCMPNIQEMKAIL
ncbi:3797_t:CDS:2, partial [Cetraspora pellucida]